MYTWLLTLIPTVSSLNSFDLRRPVYLIRFSFLFSHSLASLYVLFVSEKKKNKKAYVLRNESIGKPTPYTYIFYSRLYLYFYSLNVPFDYTFAG